MIADSRRTAREILDSPSRRSTNVMGTRAVRNQIRTGTDIQLRSSIQSGLTVGMQTMTASLDELLQEGVISEGIYQNVLKNYTTL